jgi:3-keto-disaccharide hydrolase
VGILAVLVSLFLGVIQLSSDALAWRSYRGIDFPKSGWVIQNGCLRHEAGAGGGDIITRKKYANFELELD